MLDFKQIKEYFPASLIEKNPKGILVEYLQYEFLDSLFKQAGSENLSFIGGTAIRIIHGSQRFSEDLDFDNFGLNYEDFKNLMSRVCSEIMLKGLEIESRLLKKDHVFHCYIKFPNLLFKLGISSHRDEKIFLGVDAERKNKIFRPEVVTINKFGVFRNLSVGPAPVLLALKLIAILLRRRAQGRDFYDASFLAGKARPDFSYIKKTTGLGKEAFAKRLIERCGNFNYQHLARDVEPFLFKADEKNRILNFQQTLPSIVNI